jgi:hypothetical protein
MVNGGATSTRARTSTSLVDNKAEEGASFERSRQRLGGKTSEGQNPMSAVGMKQGRHGFGGNQGVKRLKKPAGAAQSGEANPTQVAPRYLIRWRGRKPQERKSLIPRVVQRDAWRERDGPARVKL